METAHILNYPVFIPRQDAYREIGSEKISNEEKSKLDVLHRAIAWNLIKLRIFYYACIILKRPGLILTTFKTMLALRQNVWGGDMKKI